MARQFNGTSHTLQATVDLSAVNKLSLCFWLYWDSFSNNDDLAAEFTANANLANGFYIDPNADAPATGEFLVGFNCGAGGVTNASFTRPSAAAWHHYVFLFDGSPNPDTIVAYVDAVSQTLSYHVQLNSTGNFANSTLNFMSRNAASLFGAGRLAEFAIYPGVLLTADEVTSLSKGVSPLLVRPTAKPYHWPLIGRTGPEHELFYGATAAVTGATQVDHPRMSYPSDGEVVAIPVGGGSAFRRGDMFFAFP